MIIILNIIIILTIVIICMYVYIYIYIHTYWGPGSLGNSQWCFYQRDTMMALQHQLPSNLSALSLRYDLFGASSLSFWGLGLMETPQP